MKENKIWKAVQSAMRGGWADKAALAVSAAALLLSLIEGRRWAADPAWAAVLLCGVPIVARAAKALVTRFDIRADVLVAMALLASLAIGEVFAAGEVAFIMQLGGLLEEATGSACCPGK